LLLIDGENNCGKLYEDKRNQCQSIQLAWLTVVMAYLVVGSGNWSLQNVLETEVLEISDNLVAVLTER
jgi:hypothetical protein